MSAMVVTDDDPWVAEGDAMGTRREGVETNGGLKPIGPTIHVGSRRMG